jgi:hypothetical protein
MKDIRSAVRDILMSDAAVLAAVTTGNSPDKPRIYPGTLPQGVTAPSIVQNIITEDVGYVMSRDDGLMLTRLQLDAWAKTPDEAVALGGLVFDCLTGFSGTVSYGSNSPQTDVVVRAIFHDQGRDDYDATAQKYSRRRDYMVWYVVR